MFAWFLFELAIRPVSIPFHSILLIGLDLKQIADKQLQADLIRERTKLNSFLLLKLTIHFGEERRGSITLQTFDWFDSNDLQLTHRLDFVRILFGLKSEKRTESTNRPALQLPNCITCQKSVRNCFDIQPKRNDQWNLGWALNSKILRRNSLSKLPARKKNCRSKLFQRKREKREGWKEIYNCNYYMASKNSIGFHSNSSSS